MKHIYIGVGTKFNGECYGEPVATMLATRGVWGHAPPEKFCSEMHSCASALSLWHAIIQGCG